MTAPHITDLRDHLMQTLAALRDRENPMEPDRARAVAQVASVLVDTAKVEVDYLRVTNADRSDFLEPAAQVTTDSSTAGLPGPSNDITSITRHRIKG